MSRRSAWFWAPWTDLRCGQDVKDPPRCRHGGAEEATQRGATERQRAGEDTAREQWHTADRSSPVVATRWSRPLYRRPLRVKASACPGDLRRRSNLPPARIAGHWPGSSEGRTVHPPGAGASGPRRQSRPARTLRRRRRIGSEGARDQGNKDGVVAGWRGMADLDGELRIANGNDGHPQIAQISQETGNGESGSACADLADDGG